MNKQITEGLTMPYKFRDRECLSCGFKWTSEVKHTMYTANLTGEVSQQCPQCNSRAVMSSPVKLI